MDTHTHTHTQAQAQYTLNTQVHTQAHTHKHARTSTHTHTRVAAIGTLPWTPKLRTGHTASGKLVMFTSTGWSAHRRWRRTFWLRPIRYELSSAMANQVSEERILAASS